MASWTSVTIFFAFILTQFHILCWDFIAPGTSNPCVSMTGNIVLKISYHKLVNAEVVDAIHEVTIPANDSSVTGKCLGRELTDSSAISILWGDFNFSMTFHKDTVKELWYASQTSLIYNETSFDSAHDPKTGRLAQTSAELFSTRVSHKYQCDAQKTYELYDMLDGVESKNKTVDIVTTNILIAPFEKLLGASKCTEDEHPTKPPHKPTTKAPVKPTTHKPEPEPHHNGPSGGKVATICSFVSITVLGICGVVIYANRHATPDYLRVI